jgi:hypothetical protein
MLSNISQHCQAVDIFSYGSLINAYSKALYWAEPIDLLKDAHFFVTWIYRVY